MSLTANCQPALFEIAKEYATLAQSDRFPGEIVLLPSEDDPLLWKGIWFVHGGPYNGAFLKLNIMFPPDYPEHPPAIYFVTPVFHPLVHGNGLFNAVKFDHWRPRVNKVGDVLHWMKLNFETDALDVLSVSDACNKEAFKIYHDSRSSFNALANQAVSLSQKPSSLYDRDHWSLGSEFGPGLALEEVHDEDAGLLAARLGFSLNADESKTQPLSFTDKYKT